MVNLGKNSSGFPGPWERETGDTIEEFRFIPLSEIFPNSQQPRKFFDQVKIEELARSIRGTGILQPILVRFISGRYEIISGERRFRAAKRAGLSEIPVVIKSWSSRKAMLAALIENMQREDLTPVEEAKALKEILCSHGFTHDQLAEILGRSRSALTNQLRILRLPLYVQKLIEEKRISSGHAKLLAGLKSEEEILAWVNRICEENLSVFETESEISRKKKVQLADNVKGKEKKLADIHLTKVEEKLQDSLGAKVKIRMGRKKNTLQIEFYTPDDLERVIESLLPNGF